MPAGRFLRCRRGFVLDLPRRLIRGIRDEPFVFAVSPRNVRVGRGLELHALCVWHLRRDGLIGGLPEVPRGIIPSDGHGAVYAMYPWNLCKFRCEQLSGLSHRNVRGL